MGGKEKEERVNKACLEHVPEGRDEGGARCPQLLGAFAQLEEDLIVRGLADWSQVTQRVGCGLPTRRSIESRRVTHLQHAHQVADAICMTRVGFTFPENRSVAAPGALQELLDPAKLHPTIIDERSP